MVVLNHIISTQISKLYQLQIVHTIALTFVQHLSLTCQRALFNNETLNLCYYIQRQHFTYHYFISYMGCTCKPQSIRLQHEKHKVVLVQVYM